MELTDRRGNVLNVGDKIQELPWRKRADRKKYIIMAIADSYVYFVHESSPHLSFTRSLEDIRKNYIKVKENSHGKTYG